MQPEEANGHPNAHVIRRYLGSPKPPEVDHRLRLADDETDMQAEDNQGMMLNPGDRILLCSDGLTDLVRDDEILEIFEQNPLEEAGQMLVDLANARGGHDNITLISVQMPQKVTAGGVPLLRYLTVGCLSVLALGILFVAMVYGWGFISGGFADPTGTPTPPILLTDPLPVVPTPDETRPPTLTLEPPPPVIGPTSTPTPPGILNGDAQTITPWPTNTVAP
jgi:PPM family protein phosphatase